MGRPPRRPRGARAGAALPAAFATSAVVRFRALALTLKVTAGPSTLEETIEKGVQGRRGTRCRLASAVRAAQTHSPDAHAGRTRQGPRGLCSRHWASARFPESPLTGSAFHTRRAVRPQDLESPQQPDNNKQISCRKKNGYENRFSAFLPFLPREQNESKQEGKRLVFLKSS